MQSQKKAGVVAQLVEQRTENPCVTGSIPVDATNKTEKHARNCVLFLYQSTKLKDMSLEEKINADIKTAMLNKDRGTLESLRAIKSAILLEKTSKTGGELDEAAETAMLQRLIKQRREAADIYKQQNRDDLYAAEMEQAAVIERYMPEQMSAEEVETALRAIIAQTGASSMKDMGKVMGMATKQFAGKADNKTVSEMVKKMLS